MIKVYSKIQPDKLLHVIIQREDFKPGRTDISAPYEFLQCALLSMEKGKTFRPHEHVWKVGREEVITQESWMIVSGKVRAIFYDTDYSIIAAHELSAGEASITYYGGHNYEILEENTNVLEYKTGPYLGPQNDKRMI